MWRRAAADAVWVVHVAVVAAVLGTPFAPAAWCGGWLLVAHAVCVPAMVAQWWACDGCMLTAWENRLRGTPGRSFLGTLLCHRVSEGALWRAGRWVTGICWATGVGRLAAARNFFSPPIVFGIAFFSGTSVVSCCAREFSGLGRRFLVPGAEFSMRDESFFCPARKFRPFSRSSARSLGWRCALWAG